jgi:hypothetical protein
MQVTDTLKAAREFTQAGFTQTQAEALASQQERAAEEIIGQIRQALTPEFSGIRAEMSSLRAEMHSLSRDQLRSFTMIVFALGAFHLAALGVAIALVFNLAR